MDTFIEQAIADLEDEELEAVWRLVQFYRQRGWMNDSEYRRWQEAIGARLGSPMPPALA